MKLLTLIATAITCCALSSSVSGADRPIQAVVGYIMARGAALDPTKIAAEKRTRINYAFIRLKDGVMFAAGANDVANLTTLNGLKKNNPQLEVVVSVGGGGAGSVGFSDMAITAEGRSKFVDSAIAMVQQYQLDGVDLDWEYPGYSNATTRVRAEDKETYTLLLKEMRQRFDEEGKKLRRHLVTSSATGATQAWLDLPTCARHPLGSIA